MKPSLSENILKSPHMRSYTPPQKEAFFQLAKRFESQYMSHFMSPEQLAEKLGGNPDTWRQFLTLKPVEDYIHAQMQDDVEILHRQALFIQAKKAVKTGDNQAAKFIKELSEIYSNQTNQTKVVLHYVPRPNQETPTEEQED